MNRTLTLIDISNIPDLIRIAEEVATTKQPRELRRDDKTVAVLMPVEPATQAKTVYEASLAAIGSWSDLNADELIANIHRWRKEGSRPATRP
jgi:hypothetical protein